MSVTSLLLTVLSILLTLIAGLFGWALREVYRLAMAVSRLTEKLEALDGRLENLDILKDREHRELRDAQRRLGRQIEEVSQKIRGLRGPARELPPPPSNPPQHGGGYP